MTVPSQSAVRHDCLSQFHFQCWPKKCIFSSCVLELRHTTLTYTNLITLPNTYEKGCISFESYRPDRQTHTSNRLLHASAKVVGITTECSRDGRHSHHWSVVSWSSTGPDFRKYMDAYIIYIYTKIRSHEKLQKFKINWNTAYCSD